MNRIGKCHKTAWMAFRLYERDVKLNLFEIKLTGGLEVLCVVSLYT